QVRTRFALVAEAVKEQLVQDHRVHRDKLLALEPVNEKAGGLRIIELGKLLVDLVEAFHRPAVIILVVTDDQPLRHAFDLGRVAGQWLYSIRHQRSSGRARPARPLMRSLPRDKERSPRCSTPRASGSCRP